MKVLVTGATGFIGNNVIKELLKESNNEIIATSLLSDADAEKFDWYQDVTYLSCNINDHNENYFTFFDQPDVLIHLAWEGLPNFKELYHFEKNVMTNYQFIKNMVINGLKDLNVIGTCFEYGMQSGPLSEGMLSVPATAYALGKDTLRKFLEELKKNHGFHFKWIRLFYMYGEGQNPNSLIPQLDNALDKNIESFNMSGGEQLRDYLRVDKVAEYIVKIALQSQILGIINCCSGNAMSVRNFVENYIKEKGKTIKLNLGYYPYPDYVPMAFWGNNSKLREIINKKNIR